MHPKLEYRPDIDGLRAVAVVAVVLYHAFPESLPSGFAGVDIFFVLSGYLISGIILNDLSNGEFSWAAFYSRRIRRIFPALCLVLGFCLATGWYILTAGEWQSLTKHVLGGAGFVSNFVLATEAGYFDAAAHTKPLLHLWSLGIEEQFYVFWPITLVLLWKLTSRLGRAILISAILLLATISFAIGMMELHRSSAVAFYHPKSRIWELLAGAALARFTILYGPVRSRRSTELLDAAGILLLALTFVWLSDKDPYPGWRAIAPVAGTLLVVRAGSRAWFNRYILASRPAVFIGLISYPLYLWHWPLLVGLRLVNDSDLFLSPGRLAAARIVALLAAFLLSLLTWMFLETPMRSSRGRSSSFRVAFLAASMATLAALAAIGQRYLLPRPSSTAAMELSRAASDSRFLPVNYIGAAGYSTFEVSSNASHATLFAGDSHMEHYLPRIEADVRANQLRAAAVFASHDGCLPLPFLNSELPGYHCPEFYGYWTNLAQQPRFTTIVISAYWEYYTTGEYSGFTPTSTPPPVPLSVRGHRATELDFDVAWRGFETTLQSLFRAGKRVVIISSSPAAYTFDPRNGFRRFSASGTWRLLPISRAKFEQRLAPVNDRLQQVARASGAEIISPLDYLCNGDVCSALDRNGVPLFRDNNHLRASKAAEVAVFLDDLLRP